jgi:hypothetical protein
VMFFVKGIDVRHHLGSVDEQLNDRHRQPADQRRGRDG